jgi:hypothetical protein
MRIISGSIACALALAGSAASAAPKTYVFEGTLSESYGPVAPNPAWAFAVGQGFRGQLVWDAEQVAYEGFSIVQPDWTMRTFHTPIVSFSYEVDTSAGVYRHDVPTQNLADSAWQYAAIAQGGGGWNGADLRMMNYPVGWQANPPSAPLPPTAYVGELAPHNVDLFVADWGVSPLSSITPDLDLAALFQTTGARLSVRFSDPFKWEPGVERLDAVFYGNVTSLRLANAVPEPANWALMIAGFALAGTAIRRRADAPARAIPA